MDYEEALLQVTDVLKAHNRYRMNTCHKRAVETIRRIVTPKGKWITKPHVHGVTHCSECDFELKIDDTNYCPNCGADMRGDV